MSRPCWIRSLSRVRKGAAMHTKQASNASVQPARGSHLGAPDHHIDGRVRHCGNLLWRVQTWRRNPPAKLTKRRRRPRGKQPAWQDALRLGRLLRMPRLCGPRRSGHRPQTRPQSHSLRRVRASRSVLRATRCRLTRLKCCPMPIWRMFTRLCNRSRSRPSRIPFRC